MVRKMEPLIKDIIALDLKAQEEIALWEGKRADMKKQAEQKKTAIEAAANQAARQRLDDLRRQQEAETAAAKQKTLSKYDAASSKLREQFQAHQETWLNELFERCIHK